MNYLNEREEINCLTIKHWNKVAYASSVGEFELSMTDSWLEYCWRICSFSGEYVVSDAQPFIDFLLQFSH